MSFSIIKQRILLFAVGLLLVSLLACGKCDGNCGKSCCQKLKQPSELKENPKPWQPLYDEVMRVHDEVMPEMGTINHLQKELKKYATDNSATITDNEQQQIDKLILQLNKGEKGMWDWMHAFKQPEADTPEADVNTYLNAELKIISEVNAIMKSSIRDSKAFLKSKSVD